MCVGIEEWSSDEIAKLLSFIQLYKNLGAGRTEKVLSNIFMIVARFCIDSTVENAQQFITIYAENGL